MDLSSDKSSLQLTPIISTSLSVIAPRMAPGLVSSTHTIHPVTLHYRTEHVANWPTRFVRGV